MKAMKPAKAVDHFFPQGNPVYQRIITASTWNRSQLQVKAPRFRYLCVCISAGYPGSHHSPWDQVESNSAHPRADPSNAQPNTYSNDYIDHSEGADTQVIYGYLHIGVFTWARSHLWFALYGSWPGESMFDSKTPIFFKQNMGLSKQQSYFSAAHRLIQIIWWIMAFGFAERWFAPPASPTFMQ